MLEENIPLSKYGSYKIGGPARYFWRAQNVLEIRRAIQAAKKLKVKIFILGGGTNLLIPDDGFAGLVLKPDILTLKRKGNQLTVGAGVMIEDLLKFTIKNSLSGLEWAGGLPGTFGGAVRGNAGAFGGEIKDSIQSVKSLDVKTGKIIIRRDKQCRFKYRTSVYKEKAGREIILEATLKLKAGNPREIRSKIKERIQHRLERHPMEYPNIGSIFKNVPVKAIPRSRRKELVQNVKTDPIPVIPTARLITKAGLRGIAKGGAMISVKHPNFIVNVCEATAKDVAALIKLVKREVFKKFAVRLTEEVERL